MICNDVNDCHKQKNTGNPVVIRIHQQSQCVSSCVSSPTLLQTNIAIENGPFIVALPIKNGDFP